MGVVTVTPGTTAPARAVRRRTIAFGVLLAVSVVLMLLSSTAPAIELQRAVGFAFRPLEDAITSVARGTSSVLGAFGEINRLRAENESLKAENERLTRDEARIQEIERENDSLTGLLQIRGSLGFDTVAASVIARDSSELRRVVTISEGTDRGIRIGDVVVASGGALAGRVVEAGPNFARVLLINDTSSTVIGQALPEAATGEVIGQLGGVLIMQNIDSTEKIQIGQQVVTAGIVLGSGLKSPFPKGLLIGQVIDVQRDANAVVQTAFLQPAVDLDKLEYVLVITNYDGGLPPLDQVPTGSLNPDGTLPNGEQPFVTPSPTPRPSVTPRPSASR